MAAIYDTTGISVNVGRPVIQDGRWVATLKDSLSGYDHTIVADGGFDSARVTFMVNRRDVSEWLNRGLGMDIDVRGPAGTQIWNGFVDEVSCSEGARRITVGRLSEIANKVMSYYAEVIEGADEPVVGDRVTTDYAEDEESQARYGTWEKIIAAGQRTADEAEQIRDTILGKYAYPRTGYSISQSGDLTVMLSCAGYNKWLDAFTYSNSEYEDVTTDAKVKLILGTEASINGVLSTDYTRIETCSAYTNVFEDQNRTGLTIVKECASFGDDNNNAWTLGVYEDQQVVFDIVPSTIEYVYRRGTGPIVERLGGGAVDPWLVRPAQWLFMPDAILGTEELPIPNTRDQLYSDKRVAFIESVTYSVPYGLSVQGTQLFKGKQLLARLGLGAF